jgi:DNA repair protein RecN (Recombination protein N)
MTDSIQVIAITHLPQIAGKSDHHYFVYKTSENNITRSAIKKLTAEERVNEIAKMLSDDRISEAAVATAKELIKK